MERFPFIIEEDNSGFLEVHRDGLYVTLTASCHNPGNGIYRAFAVGGGIRLPLGVMIPENGKLYAKKKYSIRELEPMWPDAITDGVALLSGYVPGNEDGWSTLAKPETVFLDTDLKKSAEKITGALINRREKEILLAVPYAGNRQFPIPQLLCLATIIMIRNREYAVFKIDENKQPHP